MENEVENNEKPEEITLLWQNLNFTVPTKDKPITAYLEPTEPDDLKKPQNEDLPSNARMNSDGTYKKTIIHNLSGVAYPKQIIGLLGPSGSGKTVFLNMISDRLHPPSDSEYQRNVFINKGEVLDRELFGKIGAYVMQDDVLLETLTPRECLVFSANLRLACSQEEKERRVQKVISDLKLEKAVDTLVGNVLKKGISGGERKRTSIGVEIVTDPSLIILDELTSGLDSFTAYTIVNVMKDISKQGKTIIAIVHQPSTNIFNLFDRIYLLASGHEVYQGPTTGIYSYFKSIGKEIPPYTNPADQLIKLMHAKEKPEPEDLKLQSVLFNSYDSILRKGINEEIEVQKENTVPLDRKKLEMFRASSFGQQFKELSIRVFKNMFRNTTFTKVIIGQIVVLSILLDILFWNKSGYDKEDVNEKNGAFFFICTAQFMLTLQSVLLTFPLERGLFLREQSNRMYGVLPYYLTKSLVELPYQLLMPLLLSLLIYWAIHFRNSAESYFLFFSALLIIAFFGNSLGILLSSMFSDIRTTFAVVPVIILPLMLFAGYMSNVETIVFWLRWLQYISPIRYTLEIFFRVEYREEDFSKNFNALNPYPVHSYNFDIGTANCFIIMTSIALGTRILAYFFLKAQTINT